MVDKLLAKDKAGDADSKPGVLCYYKPEVVNKSVELKPVDDIMPIC